jgi:S-(hydroxymethyl)glutathione dehydrogenase/alcohol dehydrogenase
MLTLSPCGALVFFVFLLRCDSATTLQPGDHVIPCYTPQCAKPSGIFCLSPKTNLCPQIRGIQGQGVMLDGTSRLTDSDGKPIYH